MSTDDPQNNPPIDISQPQSPPDQPMQPVSGQSDSLGIPSSPISDLVREMQAVDTNAPDAQQNTTSMSDGKGGRIDFNED